MKTELLFLKEKLIFMMTKLTQSGLDDLVQIEKKLRIKDLKMVLFMDHGKDGS